MSTNRVAASSAVGALPGTESANWPVIMLLHRTVLFLVCQAIIALVYLAAGNPSPWAASVAWWPLAAVLTNFASFALLRWLMHREGKSYKDMLSLNAGKGQTGKTLLALLGVLLVAAPMAALPNPLLAALLYGDAEAPLALFAQPVPAGVAVSAIILVLFPLTQGLAELPTYFGYVMPRLAERWSSPVPAVLVSAFWLGAQHLTIPFIPDVRFVLWRLGMFIPFALVLGFGLRWRPALLPYLMVIHVLIDAPLSFMIWQLSM